MPNSRDGSIFQDFVFAIMYMMDERGKELPRTEVIDNWYNQAQFLFLQAVSDAVKEEIGRIRLEIVTKYK